MNVFLGRVLTEAVLRAFSFVPYRLAARTGMALGRLLHRFPSRRRRIVDVNLSLCFPQMSPQERHRLSRAHFEHVIRSYVERGVQWFGSSRRIEQLVRVESDIDLDTASEQPTIFLGFHFVGIEAGCVQYSIARRVASLYTPMSNRTLDGIAMRQRSRFGTVMIPRGGSARQALRALQAGLPVMLAADMDFGRRDSVFAPFFGVPACTLTSVSRLARLSGARVVPFVTDVLPDYKGYALRVFSPLAAFPSGDDLADASRLNAFLEQQILRIPEQYYWVHRRFKHRPDGEAPVY
ncbi:lipid A biosynthesis lauroyl acyltransferase [Ralstonia solanacearum]|uniref:Lipid A biosynthesis lauroyl acyltransferase n=1 Tax=Ralstonia solanacearum TaxID=305 RepID=A0AAD0WFU7_RALSL|nr:lipid A biosynthesis lauroyl acyltransferase [Ralstonia solanacearum]AXV80252.1 lipid A biosynthesis lauroyl acyltransferase [Ralstonia solanacearum]AXW51397.1 lipid A biosynthesis lauroyl acyltransferase [Ralstonia solanacearum]